MKHAKKARMSFKEVLTLVGAFSFLGSFLPSCTPLETKKDNLPEIDVDITNESSHDIDWVTLKWNGPNVPGGILPAGISKTAVAVPYPKASDATLDFVDAKSRDEYVIEIGLDEFQKMDPTTVENLSFVVTSYRTVEIHVNGQKISVAED